MKYAALAALGTVIALAAACGSSSKSGFPDQTTEDAGVTPAGSFTSQDGSTGPTPSGVIIISDGAPQDAPSKFGGSEDPSLKPTLFYPNDGVVLPPNMALLDFHYQAPSTATLYQLHATSATTDLHVYFACKSAGFGCAYTTDKAAWDALSGMGRDGSDVKYTIIATDGTHVGTSDPRTIGFSLEDLVGGLYYWNAGAGTTLRYEFGVSGSTPEVFMTAPEAGAGTCVGCHVLSRSGKKIALGLDIPGPAAYKVFDVATKTAIFSEAGTFAGTGANFFAFSPDETQILASSGISITLRDANTGAVIIDPLVAQGAMPDWSPDGKTVVYARPATLPPCVGGVCAATGVQGASLETMLNDGTADGGTWAQGKTLVTASGGNNYYPSFSSDGAWVVFNRSPSNHDSYDSPDAEVWITSSAADKSAIQLQRSRSAANADSWPKWAPVTSTYKGKPLLWITFSSRRAYGVKLADGTRPQIWMAALDPGLASSGTDPSYPAFWLPAQDITSGNHIPQWVAHVERKPCTGTDCAAGESCQGGVCVPSTH